MVFVGAAELVFLERIHAALQFIGGRLPHLYERGDRQHPGVVRPASAAFSRRRSSPSRLLVAIVRRAAAVSPPAPGAPAVSAFGARRVCDVCAPSGRVRRLDARFGKEFYSDAQLNELPGRLLRFWHAFRSNEIDYERLLPGGAARWRRSDVSSWRGRSAREARSCETLLAQSKTRRDRGPRSGKKAQRGAHHRRGPERGLPVRVRQPATASLRGSTASPRRDCCLRACTPRAREPCGGLKR